MDPRVDRHPEPIVGSDRGAVPFSFGGQFRGVTPFPDVACLRADALARGVAQVGVVQQPVDGGAGQGLGHEFVEPNWNWHTFLDPNSPCLLGRRHAERDPRLSRLETP